MGSANLEYPFLELRPGQFRSCASSYGTAKSVTKAGFLGKKDTKTDVFNRFSTVLGSRGSADTVRDTRGFAVKFECSAQLR